MVDADRIPPEPEQPAVPKDLPEQSEPCKRELQPVLGNAEPGQVDLRSDEPGSSSCQPKMELSHPEVAEAQLCKEEATGKCEDEPKMELPNPQVAEAGDGKEAVEVQEQPEEVDDLPEEEVAATDADIEPPVISRLEQWAEKPLPKPKRKAAKAKAKPAPKRKAVEKKTKSTGKGKGRGKGKASGDSAIIDLDSDNEEEAEEAGQPKPKQPAKRKADSQPEAVKDLLEDDPEYVPFGALSASGIAAAAAAFGWPVKSVAEKPGAGEKTEAMPTATAAAPADGAEDGSAGETSAVPNAESGALAAPVVEAGAPEALREPTSATGSPVAPVVFGEEPWRAPLVAALEKAQRDGSVAFQSARSAVASLDPEFKALTLHQVRCLRDEVVKVEKVETLRMAVSMIKEVKVMISDLQSVSVQAADAEPDADAPMPDRSAADAPVAAPDAAETAGETPVVVVVKATISPEERQQKDGGFSLCVLMELQWRRHLGRAFRELKRSEHVRAALEVAAPGVLEKTVAAEAKVDVEKDPTIEEEEESRRAEVSTIGGYL
eukprot:g28618.t1